MKNALASDELPESMKAAMLPLYTPSYSRLADIWSDAYAEAIQASNGLSSNKPLDR
jgi:hypothetical protein